MGKFSVPARGPKSELNEVPWDLTAIAAKKMMGSDIAEPHDTA